MFDWEMLLLAFQVTILVQTLNRLHVDRFLTCICLRRHLFRVTLEISGTAPRYSDVSARTLTATDTYTLRMRMCERG
jgi:hypothetical protein